MSARSFAVVATLVFSCSHATPEPRASVSASGNEHPVVAASPDAGAPVATPAPEADASVARVDAGSAAALYAQAVEAFGRDDLQNAARLFSEAYAAQPSTELAFNAGRTYERLGDVANGTRFYQLVLDANPAAALRADVTARMGSLRDYERRSREGFAQLPPGQDALAREAMTWFQRGTTAFRAGRYQSALQAFEAAWQLDTSVPELAFNLGMTHERLHHNAEAIAGFQTYLSLRRDAPDRASIEQRIQALRH